MMENPLEILNIERHQSQCHELHHLQTNNPQRFPTKLINGLPIIVRQEQNKERWRICLPTSLVHQVVKWYHFTLGHCGTEKLYDTILNRFYYYPKGLYRICKEFVCPIDCEKSKSSCGNKEYGHLAPRHAKIVPWDEVQVDFVGPWTITSNDGAEFVFSVLTCVDPVQILLILFFWMEAIQELNTVEKGLR